MTAKGSGTGASARTQAKSRGGTTRGSKTSSWGTTERGGGSYSSSQVAKHGSGGYAAIGDPDDFDGIGK